VVVVARPAVRNREAWISALVGASAAALVVVGGLIMASPHHGGSSPVARTASRLTRSSSLTATGNSLVALLTTGPTGTRVDCSVAVASGGFVATTADALVGATSVQAMRGGHWVSATVVGFDPASDVGLVHVPFEVPVAHFTDLTAVSPGSSVWTMDVRAEEPDVRGGSEPRWSVNRATVSTADAAVDGARGKGMPGIVVASTRSGGDTGDVLVSTDGSVIGIEDTAVATSGDRVFLPADLVLGVSEDLETVGTVSHGWLGIDGADAPSAGALVDAVDPKGPAAVVLEDGDVILSIDGTPVHSMAELRSQLYMLPAGSPVWLRIDRDNTLSTVEVDLGTSP
jgi:serine protease Do